MTLRGQLLARRRPFSNSFPESATATSTRSTTRVSRRGACGRCCRFSSICYPETDLKSTARTVKKAGRALGRVRDLDVAIELIGELERTSPAVAGRAAEVRRSIAARQLRARRRLVKEFDDLPLAAVKSVAAHLPKGRWAVSRAGMQECDGPVRDALREQAAALRQAIEHGSGVYFPKRAHGVRIDAKKLRYVLEMTDDPDADCARRPQGPEEGPGSARRPARSRGPA